MVPMRDGPVRLTLLCGRDVNSSLFPTLPLTGMWRGKWRWHALRTSYRYTYSAYIYFIYES